QRFISGDALVELTREFVAPASWEEEGAEIHLAGGRLVVSARKDVQRSVEGFLAALWAEALLRVRVDLRSLTLSPEAQGRLEKSGVMKRLLRGRLTAEEVRAILGESGPVVSGTTLSRPAHRARIRQLDSVSYVRDFDVEIAQGSVVGDPIVGWAREGLLVDVRPHVLTDGSVFLEALGRSARLDRPIRKANLEGDALGTMDLPACRISRFFTAGRLGSGESMAIVRREATGTLAVTLLTPRVRGDAVRSGPVRIFPVSTLVWHRVGYEITDYRDEEGVPEMQPPRFVLTRGRPPYVGWDDLHEFVRARVLSEARGEEPLVQGIGGRLVTQADPELAGEVRVRLAKLEEHAARTWRAHVRVLETDGDGEARLLSSFHLDAAAGRRVCSSSGLERAYVADWDVEVAQESRVGDPIIGRAFGGVTLNLLLDATGTRGEVAARLSMMLSDLDPELETRRTGNAVTGIIEIPRMARIRLERDLVLEIGKTASVDGGRPATGKGLRVELTVE
ncbi:MAG: hypothetical protein ACYTDY_14640, partial [Planctomycetota bacterium]